MHFSPTTDDDDDFDEKNLYALYSSNSMYDIQVHM